MTSSTPIVRAAHRPDWRATLRDVRPLRFPTADPDRDLPAHLRSASGIRQWQQYFAIIQDDVHAIALLDRHSGVLEAVALPRGSDGRRTFGDDMGNKALKFDLEACIVLPDGRLIAFGSGSTPVREIVVTLAPDRSVMVRDAHDFYAHMHARADFCGSELNLEGATICGRRLRLFQRGNGQPAGEIPPVNAFGDIPLEGFLAWLDADAPPPRLGAPTQVDLGHVDQTSFDFTDATTLPDGRVAFLAAAEDSPDAYHDGEICGCRFGILSAEDIITADILDPHGQPIDLKLEGIEYLETLPDGRLCFAVVADMDDPHRPAPMGRLEVSSPDAHA